MIPSCAQEGAATEQKALSAHSTHCSLNQLGSQPGWRRGRRSGMHHRSGQEGVEEKPQSKLRERSEASGPLQPLPPLPAVRA